MIARFCGRCICTVAFSAGAVVTRDDRGVTVACPSCRNPFRVRLTALAAGNPSILAAGVLVVTDPAAARAQLWHDAKHLIRPFVTHRPIVWANAEAFEPAREVARKLLAAIAICRQAAASQLAAAA